MLLEKDGIRIELKHVLDINNHKSLGYKEVKEGKEAKAEKAAVEVPSLEVPAEDKKAKPKGKAKAEKAPAEPKEGE